MKYSAGMRKNNMQMNRKKYLIFGTGDMARHNYEMLQLLYIKDRLDIVAFIDNNEKKWGNTFKDIPIISPKEIEKYDYDAISIWIKDKEVVFRQLLFELNIPINKIENLLMLYLDDIFSKYHDSEDKEIQEIMKIMKEKDTVDVFYFREKNKWASYEAYYDKQKDLYYIFFEGKKVYIKRGEVLHTVGDRKFLGDIWYEQDENSPHLYESENVCVEEGDILLDVGACEGNFTIHNIDKIKKGYIVECDPGWVEALQYTFEPYKDKIEIVEAFISNKNTEGMRTLDSVCQNVNFIKMDIEGAEIEALQGGANLLKNNKNLKCSICAYHREDDEKKIRHILEKYGMSIEVSKGYMLFLYDKQIQETPDLRRGIVREIKKI